MSEKFREELFGELEGKLIGSGFAVRRQGNTGAENDIPSLRCGFKMPDSHAEPMVMDIAFYPIKDLNILQFYIYTGLSVKEEKMASFREVMDECNSYAPLGQLGLYGEDHSMYFRHCLVLGNDETADAAAEKCMDVMELLFTVLDKYIERLQKI